MATIKTQNGKVITKDGKVSCECCACDSDFGIDWKNVFEITKQEHDAYVKGGTWNVSVNIIVNETVNNEFESCASTGGASGSFSSPASGCAHSVAGEINGSIFYTGPCSEDPFLEFSVGTSLEMQLRFVNGKYYARYVIFSGGQAGFIATNSEFEGSQYPPTINFTVDGNTLEAFGLWIPSWSVIFSGYNNTSSVSISASFS